MALDLQKSAIRNPQLMERVSGFEPEICGFADRRLWPLGYTRELVSGLVFRVSSWGQDQPSTRNLELLTRNSNLVHTERFELSISCF